MVGVGDNAGARLGPGVDDVVELVLLLDVAETLKMQFLFFLSDLQPVRNILTSTGFERCEKD